MRHDQNTLGQSQIDRLLTFPYSWLIVPAFLFLVNWGLKIIHLDTYAIWYDECFSIFHGQLEFDKIKDVSKWDTNPPLFNYVLHIWMEVFGISPFAARSMSVFFSALGAVVLWNFCKKHLTTQTAIFASLLYLSSNELYFYAHEARGFSLIIFLTLLASSVFFSLLRKPTIWNALGLGVLNFALFYTHYLTGFVFMVQGMVCLIYWNRKAILFYALSYVSFVALLIHWIPRLLETLKANKGVGWLAKPVALDFVNYWIDTLAGKYGVFLFLGVFLVFGLLRILDHQRLTKENRTLIWYLGLLGIFVVLVNYQVSLVLMPMFLKRYLLYTLPAFLVLLAYLIALSNMRFLFKLGIVAILTILGFVHISWNPQKGMDYKSAVAYVNQKKTDQTLILLQTKDVTSLFTYYYDRELFKEPVGLHEKLIQKGVVALNDTAGLREVNFALYDQIIILRTYQYATDPNNLVLGFLENNFLKVDQNNEFAAVEIAVFKNAQNVHCHWGLASGPNQKALLEVLSSMEKNKDWIEQIKKRSIENNKTFCDQMLDEARWVVNQQQ